MSIAMKPLPTMNELLRSVEGHRDDMIKQMTAMLRIPAMGPENGGQGEVERSRFIHNMLHSIGFEDVETHNAPDPRVEPGVRPSVIARKKGRSDRTVWIVAHMDTVSPGDEKAWNYPPFDGTVVDGKLYGRGSEDNGQAVISSLFAARALLETGLEPELGLGLAIVADEEAGSDFGIKYLIRQGLFGKDDLFYVPDSGEADGSVIEVAEKSIIWLKVTVKGKQVHASTPKKGLNALRVGSEMLLFLADQLAGRFPAEDRMAYWESTTVPLTRWLAAARSICQRSARIPMAARYRATARKMRFRSASPSRSASCQGPASTTSPAISAAEMARTARHHPTRSLRRSTSYLIGAPGS